MATVREGKKTALLVVDVQVGVMAQAWNAGPVVAQVAAAVAQARAAGMPVIWVQHSDEHELPSGSAEWQWVPALRPAAQEVLIHKNFNSAFEQTTLDEVLAGLGISHLILAGASSNWCIRATAYGALERGYDLTLVADAHSTSPMEPEDGPRLEAEAVVRELNIAMTWLSYPGRKNAAVPLAKLSFAPA